MKNIIELDKISFSREDKKILKEISFSVPYGSGFTLLGPNGAGKTTSIRIVGA